MCVSVPICVCMHICVNNICQDHERARSVGQARCQLLPAPGVVSERRKRRLIRVHPGWGLSGPWAAGHCHLPMLAALEDGSESPGDPGDHSRSSQSGARAPRAMGCSPRGWVPLVPSVLDLCKLQPGSPRDETSPCSMAEARGRGEQRDLVRGRQCSRSSVSRHPLACFSHAASIDLQTNPSVLFQKLILEAFERQGPPSSPD